jgi:uncharacterized membrane protein AbrB (regulator of aidB expression)
VKNTAGTLYTALLAGLLVMAFCGRAHAYIDPGSGSFILQMIIGALCGMLFALKIFWKQVKYFFVTLFSRRQKTENDKE